jgi:hypothetical protein
LQLYSGGEGSRRYYQDAAIRAVMEKIATCETTSAPKRALLSLATGAGKTRIAVNLLKSDAAEFYPEGYFSHIVIDAHPRRARGRIHLQA